MGIILLYILVLLQLVGMTWGFFTGSPWSQYNTNVFLATVSVLAICESILTIRKR